MYTTDDAAYLLDMAPRSVTRNIERGNIKAKKYGRDWLISEEELDRFRRERRNRKGGRPRRAG